MGDRSKVPAQVSAQEKQGAGNAEASATPSVADTPKKKRGGGGYKQRPGTVQRGMKLRLYPTGTSKADAKAWARACRGFDRWRNQARALWNLLLGMEMAAYSGEKHLKEVFDWRRIWAAVAERNYQDALAR